MNERERGKQVRNLIKEYLVKYIIENGYPPTVREIGEAVGLRSSSSVFSHLKTMEKEGVIEMRECQPRCIKLRGYKFVKTEY